jgi:hypothetical protein
MSTLTAGVQGDPLRLFFLRLFFLITAGLQGGLLRLFFLTPFYNHILVGGTYILSIDLSILISPSNKAAAPASKHYWAFHKRASSYAIMKRHANPYV